jgi:hypothetical protein
LQFATINRIVERFLLISFLSASGNAISQSVTNDSLVGSIPVVNTDSLQPVLQKPLFPTLNSDSLKKKIESPVKPKRSAAKKQFLELDPHGSVSVGYEYGVLPYVYGNNFPASGLRTEGNVSFSLMNLPLELTYYYTSIKNVIGLNNYFRVSYDASRYKESLKNKTGAKKLALKNQIGDLRSQQQQLGQKIEFYKYLERFPDFVPPSKDLDSLRDGSISGKLDPSDTSSIFPGINNPLNSCTSSDTSLPDSSIIHHGQVPAVTKRDSIRNFQRRSEKKDSVSGELSKYVAKHDSISNEISEIKSQISNIENHEQYSDKISNPYLSKAQQFLNNIKKFEIGLCNPSSSVFLINNIPLQGINIEYAKSSGFLALTYGTTVNNLLYNPRTIEGIVQGTRNYYNYFDFGNLEAGRKIFMIKGGTGSKESSHLFVGALIGKGKVDYMYSSPDLSGSSKESNLVLEIDGRYNFSPSLSTELIMGKSSVQQEDLSTEQIKRSLNEIFSNYRSYALLSKTQLSIKKTRTNLTATARWIDPYFKSFGLGFLRSDNFRYELKAEQSITRKVKYTVSFRKEEDNLLQLYNYKNILYSINNSLNLRLTRKLNIRLIYVPLFRKLRLDDHVITDRNQIATAVVSWLHKGRKATAQFNALYSRYMINADSNTVNFENLTYTQQFVFKSGFKTDLNVSWFKNNISDTLGNDTYLGFLEIGYVSKKHHSVSIGGKIAYKTRTEPQYGFVFKSVVRVYKNLSAEAEVSKIIIGDYYNTFDLEKIRKFPYYCKAQLSLNF